MEQHPNKTDRDLLVEVHGMVARVDERTKGLPERVTALEVLAEGQKRDISFLKRVGTGVVGISGGALSLVIKMFTGGN